MTTEVLIVGGGLAGSAAAIQLARHGTQVTLMERERAPQHKVCGEFLSGEALRYLDRLGVDVAELGAVPLDCVRLAGAGKATECALPFSAMSLTRRTLDAALLRQAEQTGADVFRGCTVERVAPTEKGWRAQLASGEGIDATSFFLATGKHDLRGLPRPAGKQAGLIAFKMYWRLAGDQMRSLGRAVELITYHGGYAGLQPVEDGLANLCCLIKKETLSRVGGNWSGLLAHMSRASTHLRMRLRDATPMLTKPLTIAPIPYGFVRESSDDTWHLGDQAAVIPSFTGDGMSLALHTGFLAADFYINGQSASAYQKQVAAQLRQQVGFATTISQAIVKAPKIALLIPSLWSGALSFVARRTRIAEEHLIA